MSRLEVAQALLAGYNPARNGLTLRELRQLRQLSLRQVEAATGFNRAILSMVERGLQTPSPVHLLALSDLYGVPSEEWRLVVEFRLPREFAEEVEAA